jgi:hypothetical protein
VLDGPPGGFDPAQVRVHEQTRGVLDRRRGFKALILGSFNRVI